MLVHSAAEAAKRALGDYTSYNVTLPNLPVIDGTPYSLDVDLKREDAEADGCVAVHRSPPARSRLRSGSTPLSSSSRITLSCTFGRILPIVSR